MINAAQIKHRKMPISKQLSWNDLSTRIDSVIRCNGAFKHASKKFQRRYNIPSPKDRSVIPTSRSLSTEANRDHYIDDWYRLMHAFSSIVKPPSFYEYHGSASTTEHKNLPFLGTTNGTTSVQYNEQYHHRRRCYFYNIDLHGRLYLEQTLPKNIVSSIKDIRFLDFFFARIKYTNELQKEYMTLHDIPINDYPFISICNNEWNFIRPAATPIVFHSLVDSDQFLVYGSTDTSLLREPFQDIDGIVISQFTGKLYHKLTTHSYYPLSRNIQKRANTYSNMLQQYALLRSSVALSLSDRIVSLSEQKSVLSTNNFVNSFECTDNHHSAHSTARNTTKDFDSSLTIRQKQHLQFSNQSSSGLGFIASNGRMVPILCLPTYAEPGSYSLPHVDE